MRRELALPGYDVQYLETTGLEWETIADGPGAGGWLLLNNWPIKTHGYNVDRVLIALRIQPGYPETQIDMVYFHPALSRCDNKAIGALSTQQIDGMTFQRWSRHRTPESPWRPEVDEIVTHLVLVDDWLAREFEKT
ncbi:MAG: hypothetical protein KGL39_48600 [Patescibacteria group bacterium]|nr:hypothetical protein [Patescibacteria group bacterium]